MSFLDALLYSLGYVLLGLFAIVVVVVIAAWFSCRREVGEPQAAGEELDCGCEFGAAIYTCMKCDFRRCAEHHWAHPCVNADPVVEHAVQAIEQSQSLTDVIRQAIDCSSLGEGDLTVLRNNELLLNDRERDQLDAAFTGIVRASNPIPYVAKHAEEES